MYNALYINTYNAYRLSYNAYQLTFIGYYRLLFIGYHEKLSHSHYGLPCTLISRGNW